MNKLSIMIAISAIGVTALGSASVAIAHDTETAFDSRGACEAASAGMSDNERDFLVETFPDVFASGGEVSSFLTRAWTCDRNASDGQYYIVDHRQQVLDSDWYLRRQK